MKWLAISIVYILHTSLIIPQSQEKADSCLKLLNLNDNKKDSLYMELLIKKAFNHRNIDSTVHYADELIELATLKKNTKYKSRGCYSKSLGLTKQGKYHEALTCLILSIDYAKIAKDSALIAISYSQMGTVYSAIKNYSLAIDSYNNAIKLLLDLNKPNSLAGAYFNIAAVYQTILKTDSAFYYYHLADSTYSIKGNQIAGAYAKGNMGIILAKGHQLDSARVLLNSSARILMEQKHYQAAISYQLWLSIIDQKQGRLSSALTYAQNSLNLSTLQGLNGQIRDSYEQLASIHTSMGQYQKANESLVQYYAYRDSIVNTETITQMANLRTEFEVGQKQAELDVVVQREAFQSRMKWYLMVAFLVVSTLLVLVYRNFKKSRRLTCLLKTQKEELEMANAAKDRLFSVVAHDLRSPVGAIGNLVYLANDAIANNDGDVLQHILDLMGNSNKQAEVLLNNLLHWAVTQRGAFGKNDEEIDFNQLVMSVLDIYNPIAKAKGVHLAYNPLVIMPCVKTDSNSWAVILRNLLNNAIKFTHTGGTVQVTAVFKGNCLELEVKDNGIGMEDEMAQKLLSMPVNPSQWGTNHEKGMGIGLGLVKEFVDLNNGTIQISSKPGEGSSFVVSIPVVFVHGHLNHTLAHPNQFKVDNGNVSVN